MQRAYELLFIRLISLLRTGDRKRRGIFIDTVSPSNTLPLFSRIWISPICPKLTGTVQSPTNFKQDLLDYVHRYRARQLQFWSKTIDEHDLSSVK